MGKSLIQQKRGKGSPRYRAHSFYYKTEARHPKPGQGTITGVIRDIVKYPGHYAPLLNVVFENGEECFTIAPEGVKVGEKVQAGENAEPRTGNVLPLRSIPEGASIFNVEAHPGDGGTFVRSTGGFAKVVAKLAGQVTLLLPSKQRKDFNAECRATIGTVAGAGRTEKPLLKAGTNFHKKVARNKLWPKISGTSQNAVNHPFGGSRSSKKGISLIAPRNAPPGRKVGKLRARRTGRRKR
jgi:large subunit ribosomal protein L2